MRSQVFQGETTHMRHVPVVHSFRYRIFWLSIDLDELDALDRNVGWFGYNRRCMASIHDADYGSAAEGTIREKLKRTLQGSDLDEDVARVRLITIPRIAGYVFNPVSFYLCEGRDDQTVALVAEVRNTFGEKHLYCCQPMLSPPDRETSFRFAKQFYVSPFFPVDGEYRIHIIEKDDRMTIRVELYRDGRRALSASMTGMGTQLTTASLRRTITRLPVYAASVMARIQWQAVRLYFQRRLPMVEKPEPNQPSTIPSWGCRVWYRIRAALVRWARKESSHSEPSRDTSSLSREP